MTQYIKAPFNFVPLNEKVFFPDWAGQVSHDIPFSDGEIGEIDLELTAMTPVFVRNGHTREDADKKNDTYTSFSKDENGQYFIPGTSVKGMIRNVLEIISFGKMKIDRKMKFSQREWDNKEVYVLKNPNIQTSIYCGWLVLSESGDSRLIDCGLPMRINHLRIDEFFESKQIALSFKNYFSRDARFDLNKDQQIGGKKYDPRNAAFKYALIKNKFEILENLSFVEDDKYNTSIGKVSNQKAFCERRYKVSDGGTAIKGTIVFTGQPDKWVNPERNKRNMGSGKFYEFIFPQPDEKKEYIISHQTIEQFKFIYKDSQAWQLFKNANKIPVFFRTEGKNVKDFGLALLYKLPYEQSVADLVEKKQENSDLSDLSECILGYSDGHDALKSRVQFSHFYADKNVVSMDKQFSTLGSPKASYYPIYLRQLGKNGIAASLKTYNDPDVTISGRKRYPIRQQAVPKPSGNTNLDVPFCPLPSNTKFSGKIRFHNLKPAEIGALISSITFHGNQDQLYHNLGMGKPLGYGKMKINLKSITISGAKIKVTPFLISFEKELDQFCKDKLNISWAKSDIISELFTMAEDHELKENDLLFKYMTMDPKGQNEFVEAKKLNEYLENFSILSKKSFEIKSPYEEYQRQKIEQERLLKEEREKREREERDKQIQLQQEAEEKARLEKREKEVNAGLDGFMDDMTDFNYAKKRIDQWMKKAKVNLLPEEQHETLFDALVRFYNDPKNRDKKKWELPFDQSPFSKKIASWIGDDLAREWYSKIVG